MLSTGETPLMTAEIAALPTPYDAYHKRTVPLVRSHQEGHRPPSAGIGALLEGIAGAPGAGVGQSAGARPTYAGSA